MFFVFPLCRQMMTPSWDSIKASSWRTLMRRGFVPMTCSAWRCTILVKCPMAGRREVGEGGGWGSALLMPEPVNRPFVHHTQEKPHRITAVNHRHMQYCLYSKTGVFFAESPHVHQTDPFSSPTCMMMMMGSLNIRGHPDQDKNVLA